MIFQGNDVIDLERTWQRLLALQTLPLLARRDKLLLGLTHRPFDPFLSTLSVGRLLIVLLHRRWTWWHMATPLGRTLATMLDPTSLARREIQHG